MRSKRSRFFFMLRSLKARLVSGAVLPFLRPAVPRPLACWMGALRPFLRFPFPFANSTFGRDIFRGYDWPPLRCERPNAPERLESTISNLTQPEDWLAEEFAQEAGHGFRKTGTAILKSPMNFAVAVTQGFHNAPRLYGDETVRRPRRITGFHSGLRAGRDEFVYGIHDGVTGLWRQPIDGAKDGGLLGGLRGFGMGIGGFVLKDIAAFIAPGAYFMKGLEEESLKKYQPTNFLRRARIIQGQKDLTDLGPRIARRKSGGARNGEEASAMRRQEMEIEVSRKWESMQAEILAQKNKHQPSSFLIPWQTSRLVTLMQDTLTS